MEFLSRGRGTTDKGWSRGCWRGTRDTATLDTVARCHFFLLYSGPVVATPRMCSMQMHARSPSGSGGKRKPRARTPLYFLPDAERSGASATCVLIHASVPHVNPVAPGPCAAFKPGIKRLLGTRELYSTELREAEARTGSW